MNTVSIHDVTGVSTSVHTHSFGTTLDIEVAQRTRSGLQRGTLEVTLFGIDPVLATAIHAVVEKYNAEKALVGATDEAVA